jgi:hypothetical protein
MTLDEYVSIISALIALAGLLFVAKQLHDANSQTKLASQIQLYDITRELLSLGFSNPVLFEVLTDKKGVNPVLEQRYLQMWLNQLSLIHSFQRRGAFEADVQESFDRDLRDVFGMSNMRRHWQKFGKYYPASFQAYVNTIITEAGVETDAETVTN